jgi:hypothetical protein
VAADEAELLAVKRPEEVAEAFRLEIGDLLSRRAVERLQPEVIGILVAEGVEYSFAIGGKASRPRLGALQFQELGVLRRIDWDQRQYLFPDYWGRQRSQKPPAFRREKYRIRMREARRVVPAFLRPKILWSVRHLQYRCKKPIVRRASTWHCYRVCHRSAASDCPRPNPFAKYRTPWRRHEMPE